MKMGKKFKEIVGLTVLAIPSVLFGYSLLSAKAEDRKFKQAYYSALERDGQADINKDGKINRIENMFFWNRVAEKNGAIYRKGTLYYPDGRKAYVRDMIKFLNSYKSFEFLSITNPIFEFHFSSITLTSSFTEICS